MGLSSLSLRIRRPPVNIPSDDLLGLAAMPFTAGNSCPLRLAHPWPDLMVTSPSSTSEAGSVPAFRAHTEIYCSSWDIAPLMCPLRTYSLIWSSLGWGWVPSYQPLSPPSPGPQLSVIWGLQSFPILAFPWGRGSSADFFPSPAQWGQSRVSQLLPQSWRIHFTFKQPYFSLVISDTCVVGWLWYTRELTDPDVSIATSLNIKCNSPCLNGSRVIGREGKLFPSSLSVLWLV